MRQAVLALRSSEEIEGQLTQRPSNFNFNLRLILALSSDIELRKLNEL
jgi:hypothetical protein